MSNNLNKKLLAEAFDSIVNENDAAKATRLFKRYWDICAKSSYAILESADSDFEIDDMGDDFNNEVVDEMGSDSEEKFNQAQIAVDELEDKFPSEVNDDVKAKFDEVRNIIDEMKLADDEESEGLGEDASVAIEDLKGEFEMAGELSDEVKDLFDEISAAVSGESVDTGDDVADDASDEADSAEDSNADDLVDEADGDVDLSVDDKADDADVDLDVKADDVADDADADAEADSEESRDEDEILDDVKYTAEDLAALIDELEGIDGVSKEKVEEAFSKIADPRKKMTSEEEGVNKKGTMNFGKLPGMKLDKKAGFNKSETVSKGTEPSAKYKSFGTEQKGPKAWHKVEKPANKAASAQSLMK